ncbi:MAG: hypothetical protein R6X02_23835 [Enhygromyxa sp.]
MRRVFAGLFVLTSLSACDKSGAGTSSPVGQDPCADFEVEVERFWSASIRAEVMNKGAELELEKRSGVVNKMDRISEDWVMMRTSVCKDHFVRELITKEQYAARVQCFDDRLERQRTLATALTGAGADLAAIEGALDELIAAPQSCDGLSSSLRSPEVVVAGLSACGHRCARRGSSGPAALSSPPAAPLIILR